MFIPLDQSYLTESRIPEDLCGKFLFSTDYEMTVIVNALIHDHNTFPMKQSISSSIFKI